MFEGAILPGELQGAVLGLGGEVGGPPEREHAGPGAPGVVRLDHLDGFGGGDRAAGRRRRRAAAAAASEPTRIRAGRRGSRPPRRPLPSSRRGRPGHGGIVGRPAFARQCLPGDSAGIPAGLAPARRREAESARNETGFMTRVRRPGPAARTGDEAAFREGMLMGFAGRDFRLRLMALLAGVWLTVMGLSSHAQQAPAPPDPQKEARLAWFREGEVRPVHPLGLYAIPAGEWKGARIPGIGEWIMNRARIPARGRSARLPVQSGEFLRRRRARTRPGRGHEIHRHHVETP